MLHREILTSTDEIRAAAINRATGEKIDFSQIENLTHGISNECLGITTEQGNKFILRTSSRTESRYFYRGERTALKLCADVGLPVPEVLGLNCHEMDGKIIYSSVETRMPGVQLARHLEKASEEEKLNFAFEAGAILRKINSIPADHFGYLDRTCPWKHDSVLSVLRNSWYGYEVMLGVADKVGLDRNIIEKVFKRYSELLEYFPEDLRPVLLHNDFGPHNMLVDNGKISAVFDFELTRGGDPLREIARWDLSTDRPETTEMLVQAWLGGKNKDETFDLRVEAWKIQLTLESLRYFSDDTGNDGPRHIAKAKKNLVNWAAKL